MTLKSLGNPDFVSTIVSTITTSNSLKQYYDRNPLFTSIRFDSDTVAPHASTVRGTYTVPANRKSQIVHSMHRLQRSAVASAVAKASIYSYRNGAWQQWKSAIFTNVAGDKDSMDEGLGDFMGAGESIDLRTVDLSTGGTIDYQGTIDILEFDA